MSVNAIIGNGCANYAGRVGVRGASALKVDPKNQAIFVDPKTGEATTWKPGLVAPEIEDENKKKIRRRRKLLILGLLTGLGFIFRKNVINLFKVVRGIIRKLRGKPEALVKKA